MHNWARFCTLACILLFAACTPRVQSSGPFTGTPRIEGAVLIARDGIHLPLKAWAPVGPPRAVVAALHGFNDYSKAFDRPAQVWAARGILTYAIDQRGFGRAPEPGIWGGTGAMTDDLAALVRGIRARHPGVPLFVAGDSMGGAVVLATLAQQTIIPPPKGAVLIAPAVWGRDHLGPIKSAALWLSAHTVPWFRATAEGLGVKPSDNTEMLRRLSRDPLVIKATRIDAIWGLVNLMDAAQAAAQARLNLPALLLYGTRDEVIPAEPTRVAIDALKSSGRTQAAYYATGYHMLLRDLGADVPINDVAHWILTPGTALPSGADNANRQGSAAR
ncbi:MAG: acylglycerol lipase [Alphaproteobacteria bacterium]|jgi:acylglycerol lipase